MKKIYLILILFLGLNMVANAQSPKYYMSKKGYKQSLIKKNKEIVKMVLESYMFQENTSAGVYELTKDQWVYQIAIKTKKDGVVMTCFATPEGFDGKYSTKEGRMRIFNALKDQVEYGLENGIIRPTNSDALHSWKRN